MGDWFAAARREAEEEMAPLKFGTDFTLEPIEGGPASWGPIDSQSARSEPTMYQAAWFALRFLQDPAVCLARLSPSAFLLVAKDTALGVSCDLKVSSLLRRLHDTRPEGLTTVRLAWNAPVAANAIGGGAIGAAVAARALGAQ
jgi:hypothetical protein